jgi:uncharacterized protein
MFPLGSVLFPTMVLPLHIFEPRYRELIRDVLDGGGEFGVCLIERGSEVGGADVRTGIGTVARVHEASELPDGRWAVIALGDRRLRVERWLDDDPYPRAEVDDLPDPAPGAEEIASLPQVVHQLRTALAKAAEVGDAVAPATVELSGDPVLASHQAAALAPIAILDRQTLLAAPSVGLRLARLDALLADAIEVLDLRLGGGAGGS